MNKLSKIKTAIMGLVLIIFAIGVILSITREFKFNEQSNKERIYEQVKEYLIENDPVTEENVESAHTFVDIEELGIKGNYKKSFVYVWALTKKYYIKDGKLVESGSMSMPYSFLYEKGKITKQITSKSFSEEDLRQVFPPSIYNQIIYIQNLSEDNINRQIEEYYADYLSNQKYHDFIGKWYLKRATIKGEDTSLTQIFGTGIEHGGKITLSPIGRYTELIGVYSYETIDDYQGVYSIKNNKIILSGNSGHTRILTYDKKKEELCEQVDKDTNIYFTKEKISYKVDQDLYINTGDKMPS